jgi:hypothetical protein
VDLQDLLPRLGLDLLAAGVLIYGLFQPRHRRSDLCVVYAMFNVGLFLAVAVIAAGEVSIGVGFGLFAVLSIVRLRSEPFSNLELAYFFLVIVLALVTALAPGGLDVTAVIAAVVVGTAAVVDHPRLGHRTVRRTDVTLERVFGDQESLRRHLEERLDAAVTDVRVVEIDYVRETTRAAVRFVPHARPPADPAALDHAVSARSR